MGTVTQTAERDQTFWQKMMLGIALFILFGFAQFALRGFVRPMAAPLTVHLHGLIMLAWLGLAVAQATLIRREDAALHRRLGWIGVFLAAAVVVIGLFVGVQAVQTGRQPPFFSPPYFLALSGLGVLFFAGLVAAAVANRRRTEWHRRLMVGAMIMIMEPALGRILPMPFIMPWGEWLVLVVQLTVFAIVVRHDRKVLGHVHPATLTAMAVVALAHVTVETVARVPAWAALAEGLAPT